MRARRFRLRTLLGLACGLAACAAAAPDGALENDDVCVLADGPRPLPGLGESSGVAISRITPGLLWSHNDSGAPLLFAFGATGEMRGRVRVPNAAVEDWEAITAAPCPAGNCLYIADIGDNHRVRRRITLYRIPEPQPQDAQAAAPEVFTATYPDGPRDAEALFVAGDDLFIVSKEASAGLYRLPTPLQAGADMRLERVAELPLRRVTDAATSADGAWVAIRTGNELVFYRTADLMSGEPAGLTVSLRALKEPQGEGIALDEQGTVYLTSEGGGAGSLRTLRCTLPQSGTP